jgi:hypothetical protein
MKQVIFFLFTLCSLQGMAQLTVDALRKEYGKASTDSSSCAKLYNKTKSDLSTDNVILGYKGAISAAMANHVKNKSEKIKLFNAGKKQIEQSVKADSTNVELRFLRYTIQSNCPKALGYTGEMKADKKFILENIGSVKNSALQKKMTSFLKASKDLTQEEKKNLPSESKNGDKTE